MLFTRHCRVFFRILKLARVSPLLPLLPPQEHHPQVLPRALKAQEAGVALATEKVGEQICLRDIKVRLVVKKPQSGDKPVLVVVGQSSVREKVDLSVRLSLLPTNPAHSIEQAALRGLLEVLARN